MHSNLKIEEIIDITSIYIKFSDKIVKYIKGLCVYHEQSNISVQVPLKINDVLRDLRTTLDNIADTLGI